MGKKWGPCCWSDAWKKKGREGGREEVRPREHHGMYGDLENSLHTDQGEQPRLCIFIGKEFVKRMRVGLKTPLLALAGRKGEAL